MKHKRLIFFTLLAVLLLPDIARGEAIVTEIERSILQLQPRTKSPRLEKLAELIVEHSTSAGIHPKLTTALIFRESSFSWGVERGLRREKRGAFGLMQIMPGGAIHNAGRMCYLGDADCNIRTGTIGLQLCREECPTSWWTWISMYGTGKCQSQWRSRRDSSTITLRRIYCSIEENCDEYWPAWSRTKR